MNQPDSVAVDAQGGLFISDDFNCRVRLVRGGTISTVAGDGSCLYSGDGGAATQAGIEPTGIALAPDGTLYITESPNAIEQHDPRNNSCRVRAVRDGVINTIAGNDCNPFDGDGRPALSVSLWLPWSVAVGATGDVYIAGGCRVLVLRAGIIQTVAGHGPDSGTACEHSDGDGGPATAAGMNAGRIAVGVDGDVYIADGNCRLRLVHAGIISTIAGNGTCPG